MKEYLVLINYNNDGLEADLNKYALQGWVLKFVNNDQFILERDKD